MDRSDLDHNRRGQLGPAQRERLEAHLRTIRAAGRLAAGFLPPGFVEACKADLAEGRVEAIDGQVTFEPAHIAEAMSGPTFPDRAQRVLLACQNAYVVRTEGSVPLSFAPGTVVGPGSRRLYVAPRTSLVVGAEPGAATGLRDMRHLQRVLFAAQRTTDATLAENRRGCMTDAQRAALAATPRSFAGTGLAILASMTAGGTYALASDSLARGKSLLGVETVLASLLTLVFLAVLPSSIAAQRRANAGTKADAAEGKLVLHEGPIHKSHFIHRSRSSNSSSARERGSGRPPTALPPDSGKSPAACRTSRSRRASSRTRARGATRREVLPTPMCDRHLGSRARTGHRQPLGSSRSTPGMRRARGGACAPP